MDSLNKQFARSYTSRNFGGTRKGILDFSKIDGDIKFYKIKEGVNKIDIIPYVMASKNNPIVHSGDFKVGQEAYVLDIWVHKSIGPAEADVVCPKKNYGKVCPICEQASDYQKAGKKEEMEALQAKRRVFYNIMDAMKPEDGLQVLEQSHWKFEKELVEAARAEEELARFFDPENGVTVKFRGSPGTFKGRASMEPKGFGFVERKESIAKLVKKAISFDDLLTVPTSDECFALMNGVDEDDNEDEEDEAPAKSKKKRDDDDEDEDVPVRNKKPPVEDDDEDEAPPRKSKKDEEEEEAPPPKKAKGECPFGHKFGDDNDTTKDCDKCPKDTWRACAKAAP
jgi:hypothetical protein